MTRKVFYSFHFDNDAWRAGQVRNIGVVDGSEPVKVIVGRMLNQNQKKILKNGLIII